MEERLKILIIRLSAIGDTIHTLPMVNALRKTYPDAQIDWLVEDKAAMFVENNPLLDNVSIKGAKAIIINITGSKDITTFEHEKITKEIQKQIDNEYANIITGSVFDDELEIAGHEIDLGDDTKQNIFTVTLGFKIL